MENMVVLDCLDSDDLANARRQELDITRDFAIYRARVVVQAVREGSYDGPSGEPIDWQNEIIEACLLKKSIAPWQDIPTPHAPLPRQTRVQVSNETTLAVALRLLEEGHRPLALNFANGVSTGGGFLGGARAQEEALCRCSSLYWTLLGDPMYLHHGYRQSQDSTDWAIVSPRVPFIYTDSYEPLPQPKHVDIITSAAPFAPSVGQPESREQLRRRILRILRIAHWLGYETLVLGAWGCGAFGNDPATTAADFKSALTGPFKDCFTDVVFAISDWSPQRRFLGPFRDTFAAG